MNGVFLDTTVVVELAETSTSRAAADFVSNNLPAKIPYYALRELLAGKVRTLCDAHNKLKASENSAEAISAFMSLPAIAGRKRDGAVKAIAEELNRAFRKNPDGSRSSVQQEVIQSLALKCASLWTRAKRPKLCNLVQSLGCFSAGELSRGESGELRGPHDSFDCKKNERCAAAAYLAQDEISLDKLLDALHPRNLDDAAKRKRENTSRRKALKELKNKGARDFDKRLCRALGDAYFAVMCPHGMKVVTTNIVDHKYLCEAIGKQAIAY